MDKKIEGIFMRWLIIVWLLFSAAGYFYSAHTSVSYTHRGPAKFNDVREAFLDLELGAEKAKAVEQLNNSVAELQSILYPPTMKLSYIIMAIIGLAAILSAILLIARKATGVKLALITLSIVLLWSIYASFSKESYRQRIESTYKKINRSVSVLVEEEVGFSPVLQEALTPKLAMSLPVHGLNVLFLLLLFLKRKTIIKRKTIQEKDG